MAILSAPLAATPSGGKGHGVNDERGAVLVQQVNHFNEPVPGVPALDEVLRVANFAPVSVRRVPHHRFNFRDRATVLRGMFPVECDPSEFGGRQWRIYNIILCRRQFFSIRISNRAHCWAGVDACEHRAERVSQHVEIHDPEAV
jgi:hypothetical protein